LLTDGFVLCQFLNLGIDLGFFGVGQFDTRQSAFIPAYSPKSDRSGCVRLKAL